MFKSCQPDREVASDLRKRKSEATDNLSPKGKWHVYDQKRFASRPGSTFFCAHL